MKPIIECVPNFSEGQDETTIAAIAAAVKSVEGVQLLHQDSGKAANRTVYPFAGEVQAVFEAAYRAIAVAVEKIDMRKQKGEHPRIGACDVCPFIPISGISLKELVPLTRSFAEKVSRDFRIPIFFYEESATSKKRKNLASHRIGQYEALRERLKNGKWKSDFGEYNPSFGGCVMGVRKFLVAYNINLNTTDAHIAQEIAFDLRELGRPIGKENGKTIYKPGKLKNVKAIGWYIKDFDRAQVSINLTDFEKTPLHMVYEQCKLIANVFGVKVTGSEVIGLIPKAALLSCGKFYLKEKANATEEEYIQSAIEQLNLGELNNFDYKKRIIEYALMQK